MAPSTYPTLTAQNGTVRLPALGYGTFDLGSSDLTGAEKMKQAIIHALKTGYRHIDTAAVYNVEGTVGAAIKESGIPREEIFVTTKLWNHMHAPEDVEKAINDSLERLGLEYVDLYLMHWPVAFKRTDDYKVLEFPDSKDPVLGWGGIPIIDVELSNNHEPTWKAMEKLQRAGKAKHIGVSNFTIKKLKTLLEYAEIKPVVNQVESHPYLPQKELLAFLKENDILLTAYSPLGSQAQIAKPNAPQLREDPTLVEISARTGHSWAQLVISWGIRRGTSLIPKSATLARIEENFTPVELSDEDFEAIDTITEKRPELETSYTDFFDISWGAPQQLGASMWKY